MAATVPVITSQPSHMGVAESETVEFSITASGGDLEYQWFFNATNLIEGATNSTYSIPAVTQELTGLYHVVVNNSAGAKVSSLIRLSILTAPIITSEPQGQTNSQGATVSFSVDATGSGSYAKLSWEVSPVPGVVGYFVYYGASSHIYSHVIDAGNVTNTVITNLTAANKWFFAVSAYNAGGIESELSPEVSASGAFTYNWFFNSPLPIPTSTSSVHKILLASPADNGSYYVVLNNHLGSATSAVANLEIVGLPTFFRLPEDIEVPLGSDLVLDVWAGGAEPLHYQWFHDSEPIPDVDFRSLNFTNITLQDAGAYHVIASNIFGVITSSVINVSIISPPNVLFGLQDRIDIIGGTATFLAIANGTGPLQYLWFHNETNLIAVTESGSFPVSNLTLDHSGTYQVVVTNSAGSSTSAVATLTVLIPPSVAAHPQNFTAIQGSNALFSVSATGSEPLSFQWLSNSVPIEGAIASTLNLNTVQPSHQANYSVIVMNPVGNVTSSIATLTVLIPPSITAQPQSATANQGGNASFTVTAGGTAPLSFQWFSNSVAIAGATSGTLNLNNVQAGHSAAYRVAVSNIAGVVTSAVANLTVILPPVITQQPQNTTVNQDANTSFSVTATGVGPLSFQWFSNSVAIAGATTSTLNLNNVQAGHAADYRVVITNSAGSVTSSIASLAVIIRPAITQQPQNRTVNQGSTVSFSVTATGTAPLAFQWFSNSVAIAGATSSSLNLNNLQAGHAASYRVVVTNSAGSVTSATASLTVILRPAITAQPQNTSANQGGNASFAVTATGTAPLSFQWFSNSVAIAGSTTTALNLNNVRPGHAAGYHVVVSNAAGSVTSSVATLAVILPPAITGQPQNTIANQGASAAFTVAVNGTAPFSFQWFSNSVAIVGANNSALNLNNVQAGHAAGYHVIISNAAGSITSSVANLTVILRPVITQQPQNASSSPGGNASFSVAATGTGPLSFQWFSNSVAIAGATASTLNLNNINAGHGVDYRVVITNTAGSVTSSIATLTVLGPVSIIQQPQNTTANLGSSPLIFVVATGSNPLSFQWFSNSVAIAGANSSSLTLNNVQATHAAGYHVVISNPAGSITSSVANLTIRIPPSITQHPQSGTVNPGSTASFSVMATGTAPLLFQWYSNSVAIAGAAASTLNLNNVHAGHSAAYHVVVNNAAGSATSHVAQLTVVNPPTILNHPENVSAIATSNATFSVSVLGSGPLAFQWFFNTNTLLNLQTNSTLTFPSVVASNAGTYHVVITNFGGSVTSEVATLTILRKIFSPATQQGSISFTILGSPGDSYSIEFSTNNEEWDELEIITNTSGSLPYTNSTTGQTRRFYRARLRN